MNRNCISPQSVKPRMLSSLTFLVKHYLVIAGRMETNFVTLRNQNLNTEKVQKHYKNDTENGRK